MPGSQRRINAGVAQRLLAEPCRFHFFQAVRILERLFVRLGVRAREVVPYRLRFRNSVKMDFPASEIEKLVAYTADDNPIEVDTPGAAPDWTKLAEVDITPAFMSMLGGRGVLPLGYSELLAEREFYHRDHAARAFFDIFFNRAAALFYAAWKKYRLAYQYELDHQERFLPLVLALAGVGTPALRSRLSDGNGEVFDQAIAHYANLAMQRPLSATFLQRMLTEYLAAAVRVEQFAGAWYEVPPEQRSQLGGSNTALGRTALTGQRVWQRNLRLRLWIGPLRTQRYRDFLPGGSAAAALAKWLTLLGGNALEYQVQLILHRDDIHPTGLAPGGGGQLGWDTFLNTRGSGAHRSDASYLVHTLA